MPTKQLEFVENSENFCQVILLLDTPRSMAGRPIKKSNWGVAAIMKDYIKMPQIILNEPNQVCFLSQDEAINVLDTPES